MIADTAAERRTDKIAISSAFGRAAVTYDSAARLQRLVAAELMTWLPDDPRESHRPVRVLDVGCGTGHLLRLLSETKGEKHLVGLDIAWGMLNRCRERPDLVDVSLILGDAERWPFAQGMFDWIVSNFALQWCDDAEGVLDAMAGSLAPGGRCLLALPVEGTLRELSESWDVADPGGGHVSRFLTPSIIESAATGAGLIVSRSCLLRQTVLYKDVRSLARELKVLGAHNGSTTRARHLTGRSMFEMMLNHYEGFRRSDGKLPASWCVFMAEFAKEAL